MEIRIVAAKMLHDRARDGVTNQVHCNNLTVELFVPETPGKECVKSQVQEAVINFGRMQWHVQRRIGKVMCQRVGERDGPGQIRLTPVTTPVKQAAHAAKKASQRNTRREDIGGLPKRQ